MLIAKAVLDKGLDSQTAYEIVSIDIADIDVGDNVGARLQADQAEADMRIAQGPSRRTPCPCGGRRTGVQSPDRGKPRQSDSGGGRSSNGYGRFLQSR